MIIDDINTTHSDKFKTLNSKALLANFTSGGIVIKCLTIICATVIIITTITSVFKKDSQVMIIPVQSLGLDHKELQVGLYDSYTYCIRTVMKSASMSGFPVKLQEAEATCTKFSKQNGRKNDNFNGKMDRRYEKKKSNSNDKEKMQSVEQDAVDTPSKRRVKEDDIKVKKLKNSEKTSEQDNMKTK